MSDLTTAEKWDQKRSYIMKPILHDILDTREKQARQHSRNKNKCVYRGLEHGWYGVWNCEWTKFCEGSPTLVPVPQHRLMRTLWDDAKKVKEALIPDFALLRVANPELEVGQTRRPALIVARQKTVALMEIKPPPTSDITSEARSEGINEARVDLLLQVRLFFASERGRKEKKAVIGISAAGDWWTWERFTPDLVKLKPLSKNKDRTYRGSEEPDISPSSCSPIYYQLGTTESEMAMAHMLEAILNLPGSEIFGDEL